MKCRCKNCNGKLNWDRENISKGYYCVCLTCDEDFYSFEVKRLIK